MDVVQSEVEELIERAIKTLHGKRTAVLTGAGISTDSGIPDYRGEGAPKTHPMTLQNFLESPSYRQRYWLGSHLGWGRFAGARSCPGTGSAGSGRKASGHLPALAFKSGSPGDCRRGGVGEEAGMTDRKSGRNADGTFGPGNPGKPRGTRHKATRAALALLDGEAEALTRQAVTMALGGDVVALRLCLERIAPPRKDAPVAIALPPMQSAADAAKAKWWTSQVQNDVIDACLQIFGGYGYTKDFPVEKFYRDAKLCTIGEGTSEIQKLVIAKNLLQE